VGAVAHGMGFGVADWVDFGLPTTFARDASVGVPRC
jgi:hypothetical protein